MVSFHISDTPEPQQGKSSPIQKGLLPRLQGKAVDLCGEGLGFGTPILQYRRDFYFPGSATVNQEEKNEEKHWTKVFRFNLIERKQQDSLPQIATFSWVLPRLHNRIYKVQTGRQLLKLVTRLTQWGYQRGEKQFALQLFIPVKSRGESHSRFSVMKDKRTLDVEISFDTIVRNNLQTIFIANELGGHHFTQYYDGSGINLVENQIEPWAKIKAQWAVFYAPQFDFGFRVNIPEGIDAYRGREVFEDPAIYWSGIILQLPKSTTTCRYQIQFGTLTQMLEDKNR